MCNLSEGIKTRGIEKGISIGEKRGEQRAHEADIKALMKNLNMTRHEAMSVLGIATES